MAGNVFDGYLPVCAAQLEGAGLDELPVALLGVGKTAATIGLIDAIARLRPRGLLLFGVAGAFPARHRGARPVVQPGDVCLVGSDVFGDEGVETPSGFQGLAAMGLGQSGPFAADDVALRQARGVLGVPVLAGATVSTCSGTDERSRQLFERTGADVETMEGAAVAMACARHDLPWVQLRAISNWTGDRGAGAWDLSLAVQNVQRALRRLFGVG